MEITQETVAAAVNSVASARGRGTLPNMMAFARALKQLGVKVSLSQVIDAARSADLVDIAEKQDFRALLRSNMILQKEDFPVFDMVFDCFWREQSYERVPMETLEIQGTPSESGAEEGGDEEGMGRRWLRRPPRKMFRWKIWRSFRSRLIAPRSCSTARTSARWAWRKAAPSLGRFC